MINLYPECLTIISDREYGYNVYYKDTTNNVELSFYTDENDIINIILEIKLKIYNMKK